MAGHETRMLLLGAVALFEPVNGYQIRRELVSWQVESWANVNPGSIYNGLATLTRQGHLVRHDLRDGGREVAVYELTEAGRDELQRLLATSLVTVDMYDAVAFHAAVGMLPLVRRPEAIAHLQARLTMLEDTIEHLAEVVRDDREKVPPHACLPCLDAVRGSVPRPPPGGSVRSRTRTERGFARSRVATRIERYEQSAEREV
jgi:DNA-binding PadR family transcriptional regulator